MRRFQKVVILAIFALFAMIGSVQDAVAALQSKTLDYQVGAKNFKGYLAWDDAFPGKRPGILVVHEFWGLNDYAKSRADQLAKLGYVAFAGDMFGDGKVAAHPDEARAMAKETTSNVAEWVARAQAALDTLRRQPNVDPTRLAAIGYCFGGATVLQLAFSGADLKLSASFHGSLPVPESATKVRGELLIFHGGSDTFISAETIQKFRAKLDEAKISYRFIVYPGAVHAFTVPGAEKRGIANVAYNAEADQKSWQELVASLSRVFSSTK
ncbi:MAG TPA: dienelactone hydrolase family protein [bacterium]|nr:dienelactone hydrolase family protein [bacterium]